MAGSQREERPGPSLLLTRERLELALLQSSAIPFVLVLVLYLKSRLSTQLVLLGLVSGWLIYVLTPKKHIHAEHHTIEHDFVKAECAMSWMNNFIRLVWPRVQVWVHEVLNHTVAPSIAQAAPSALKQRIRFSKVDLGHAQPVFEKLVMSRRQDHNGAGNLELSLDFKWESECDICLEVGPWSIAMAKLCLVGSVAVIFVVEPPLNEPPFIRALQVFFPRRPELSVEFGGLASVAEFPGILKVIREALASAIDKMLVLPNCRVVNMGGGSENEEFQCAQPLGILRLTIHEASGIAAADTRTGLGLGSLVSSDPYVRMVVGCQQWTSPVVPKTLHPVWTEHNVKDFLIYEWRQPVEIEVWDEDLLGPGDLIGFCQGVTADDLRHMGARQTVPLKIPSYNGGDDTGSEDLVAFSPSSASPMRRAGTWGPGPLNRSATTTRLLGRQVSKLEAKLGTLTLSAEALRFRADCLPRRVHDRSGAFLSVKLFQADLSSRSRFSPPYTARVVITQGGEGKEQSVQATSRPSQVAPPKKRPPQELARAVQEMLKNQVPEDLAAELAGLTPDEVSRIHAEGSPRSTTEAETEAVRNAALQPYFKQEIHLLLQHVEGEICLELMDRNSQVVAEARLRVEELIAAPASTVDRHFVLHSKGFFKNCVGTLHAILALQTFAPDGKAEGLKPLPGSGPAVSQASPKQRAKPQADSCWSFLTGPFPRRPATGVFCL